MDTKDKKFDRPKSLTAGDFIETILNRHKIHPDTTSQTVVAWEIITYCKHPRRENRKTM